MRRIRACIAAMALGLGLAFGQSETGDCAVLAEAISMPSDLNNKAKTGIAKHIGDICEVLKRHGKDASVVNDGAVVKVTIPCSMLFRACSTDIHNEDRCLDIFKDVVSLPTMYKLVVAVSSDDTGDDTYRQDLTDARATAIVDYLASAANINDINIVALGLSDCNPVAPNNSIEGRGRNRRVDIYIVPAGKMIEMAKAGTLVKKSKK